MTDAQPVNPAGSSSGADPLAFLREWAKDNPQSAGLLLAGVACFAAVAAVGQFGVDLQASLAPVAYILGTGFVLIIFTRIINDKLMMSVLSWFVLLLAIIWCALFIAVRGVPFSPTVKQQISCVVWFLQSCEAVADNLARAESLNSITQSSTSISPMPTPLGVPSQTSPVTPGVVVPPNGPSPGPIAPAVPDYRVLVQFAGSLTREMMTTALTNLKGAGWDIQGYNRGGQRTSSAAGLAEVRFRDETDAAAAGRLADALNALGITPRKILPRRNPAIDAKTLEVWMSN